MQVMMKIAEKQRKTRAGFVQLMNYISRDSFKTFGVGTSDNKDIAIKHYLSNKDLHKKNRDGKDRFTYHEIFSFGADVPIETVIDIMLEFCEVNFYDKDFNSFFAVHTDTNNIHCHVIADNVNFETGDMIHSVTEKQYESMSQKKKEKNETFVYEHQRKLFEDICIKHGLDISMEERYEYMHEQKVKEGRKWLTKEQYRAKQDKDSWSNEIKDRLEQIYKNEDVNEDNIKDIATQYGLEVTRHNKEKKYITFALVDSEGKRTNQKLKLVQELNKKRRKTQDEVTEDTVKLAVKLNTLETQEKELKKDSSENVFNYDNFFGGKKKEEIEKREETREEILEFFAKEKEKLRIRLEAEAKAKEVKEDIKPVKEVKEDIKPVEEVKADIRPVEEVKEDIKTPVNTYIVEDSKTSDFELEKEYKTEKEILDNFYKDQEDKKKEQDSKAKALEEEVKNIEKAEIDKITQADEVLRRLNIEEEERQAEAKAKKEAEEKAKQDEEKKVTNSEPTITESKEEITSSNEEITDSKSILTESKSKITSDSTITNSEPVITISKQEEQEEQEEKQDLEPKESKQVDLDSLMSKIDYYELVEKYDLYDTLPLFQIFIDELIYDSETGEGDIELAKSLIIDTKGEEYWRNMNPKDITKWEEVGVFTVAYTDINDNIREYTGYEDYSKSTIKHFLKENTEVTEELAKQYMSIDSKTKTKDKEQDSKSYEDKDREIDFN
jgi:exonuclease SbcC